MNSGFRTWFRFSPFLFIYLRQEEQLNKYQMGCTFSGLNALYDAVNGGGDVWINETRFKIVRQLGEGGFAYVFLVKEVVSDSSASGGGGLAKKFKDPSHVSGVIYLSFTLIQFLGFLFIFVMLMGFWDLGRLYMSPVMVVFGLVWIWKWSALNFVIWVHWCEFEMVKNG